MSTSSPTEELSELPPEICENAISFVNRVNVACRQDGTPEKYQQFLDFLVAFRENRLTIPELLYATYSLFDDNLDLFIEFLDFVPRNMYEKPPSTPVETPQNVENASSLCTEDNSSSPESG